MTSRRSPISRATRRTPLVILLAAALLIIFAGVVWAAWGVSVRSAGRSAVATATPTRTPRPVTPAPVRDLVQPEIIAFTPTPTLAPLPFVETPAPMPAPVAQVVREYGMDPTRRFVIVDPNVQKMLVWDPAAGLDMGGQTLRELPVSTGDTAAGYRTPPWYGLIGRYEGTFQAFGVYADEGWYLFEDGGKILIHGAPYKLVDGKKVYEDMAALGAYPASHGCIRLAPDDAVWFTRWGPQGVPLVILPVVG